MGAEDQSFRVLGGNEQYVKQRVKAQHENDCYEHGHGGYTGTWAEWNGTVTFHNKKFKSYNEAYNYLFGDYDSKQYKPGVLKKWDDAIAVQFRNGKGQLEWLVGAIFSC